MSGLFRLLRQRHPAHDDPIGYLRTITLIAILVFLILWTFTPFNFQYFPKNKIFMYALLYVGGAYLTMLVCLIWIIRFPKLFAAETWTLGKEMLFVIYQFTTIAFTVWLITGKIVVRPGADKSYFYVWSIIATGGILPYLVVTSFKHIYQLKQHLRDAIVIQGRIDPEPKLPVLPLLVPGLLIPVYMDEFLYAKSDGNYLHLFAEKNGDVQAYTVRNTLKQLLAGNGTHNMLFQCHRTYVINTSRILSISGNAAGCMVKMHPELPEIPVSRAHVAGLKQILR